VIAAERQVDAERGMLACILIDTRDTVMQRAVAADMTRDWFADPKHGHVYQAAFDLYAAGKVCDCVTIQDALRPAGIVDGAMIDALMSDAVTTQHAPFFIEQMTAHHTRRTLSGVLMRLSAQVENLEPGDVADFVALAQEQICRIGVADSDVRSLADVARAIIAEAKKPPEQRSGIPWPWKTWQRNLEPLTDELVYIAARPSVGKTALALNIAAHAALAGHRVGYASLESPREKIVGRLVQALSETDFRRLYRNPHSIRWPRVDAVPALLEPMPLDIVSQGMTCERLYAWGKAQKSRGAELLIIDNMKHIRPSVKYSSPVEMFRDFSARIKWMRDDLGMALVVLHHLSHELKLSWSDDIERDADMVLFMLEDEKGFENYQSKDSNDSSTQSVRCEVRKNRDGPCKAFFMELCGETQRVSEEAKPVRGEFE